MIECSNLGYGLLRQILSEAAGKSYEDLVVEQVCRPLGMHDTRIMLRDADRARLAERHDDDGNRTPGWDFASLAGAGTLRSNSPGTERAQALSARGFGCLPNEGKTERANLWHGPCIKKTATAGHRARRGWGRNREESEKSTVVGPVSEEAFAKSERNCREGNDFHRNMEQSEASRLGR